MPLWTRKAPGHKELYTSTLANNRTCSRLLQLPGELRNVIYSFIIYPKLGSIMIADGTKQQHFGKTALNLSIFRVSQQIRSEALSYLCSTKCLKICGVDTANAFFSCLGDIIVDVKHLTIVQPIARDPPLISEKIDAFFKYLDHADSLKYFNLHIGCARAPYVSEKVPITIDRAFVERTSAFRKDRQETNFQWTNEDDELHIQYSSASWDVYGTIRSLLGDTNEVPGGKGLVFSHGRRQKDS